MGVTKDGIVNLKDHSSTCRKSKLRSIPCSRDMSTFKELRYKNYHKWVEWYSTKTNVTNNL